MSSKSIKVFAPATVANVVCGFDILGFAVNEPGDELLMELSENPGVIIESITGHCFSDSTCLRSASPADRAFSYLAEYRISSSCRSRTRKALRQRVALYQLCHL